MTSCCCEFDEDGETILRWCLIHARVRDERDALKRVAREIWRDADTCNQMPNQTYKKLRRIFEPD